MVSEARIAVGSSLRKWMGLCIPLVILATTSVASAITIQTYGGNLIPNGTATNIGIGASGIAIDASGRIYHADSSNHTIRRIDPSTGVTTVIAGTGTSGFSGDGGLATSAQLNSPKGVTVDSTGNVYVADTSNHRIRKIDTSGTITTVAGTGTGTFGGDNAAATAARVNSPQGVAVDSSDNIYIADTSNNRIRKITVSTGNISTIAGNGTGGYLADNVAATGTRINAPRGVVVDSAGNVYIADTSNNRIRKVSTGGTITTVAGTGTASFSGDGGAATSATIRAPQALTLDSSGNIYIADTTNHRIRKVTSGTITTITGTGTAGYGGDGGVATSGQISSPSGIAVDSTGNVYIGDTGNLRLRKIGGGNISTFAGTGSATFGGDGGPVTNAQFTNPQAIVFDSAGNRYISDSGTHRIRKVTPSGTITTIAGTGVAGFSGDNGPATSAQMNTPLGMAKDAAGNLYFADGNNNRIRKINLTTGVITTVAGDGTGSYGGDNGPATSAQIFGPFNVAFDSADNMLIADTGNNRIRKVNTSGTITTIAGTGAANYSGDNGPATAATFNTPVGLTVDTADNIYVTDYSNGSVRKIAGGIITTIAGNGANGYNGDTGVATSMQMNSPRAVAVDAAGNVFIADTTNSRIRKVDTSGNFTTIAGDGNAAFSGDGGPAASARVSTPQGITIIGTTGILFSDTGNRRIRLITYADLPGAPTAVTGTADNAQVALSWTAPASNGGSAVTGYNVQVATVTAGPYTNAAGGCASATMNSSAATTCTTTGLTNGTTYYFRVAAVNAVGTGSYSSASMGIAPVSRVVVAPPDINALPVSLPGVLGLPQIANLSADKGPEFLTKLIAMLNNTLATQLQLVTQTSQGAVILQGFQGGQLAFMPHSFQSGDNRSNGIYPLGDGRYQAVVDGNQITLAPAVVHLDQLAGLLPSGTQIYMADNGVLTANIGGVVYVVQPALQVVNSTAGGAAQLVLGGDGFFHFIDTQGNDQILYPAFRESNALLAVLHAIDALSTMKINLDGTATVQVFGQTWTLTPDLTLIAVTADKLGQAWWQDSALRYFYASNLFQPIPNMAQGLTAR